VADYRFGDAAEQETVHALVPLGAEEGEVGIPVGCGINDSFTDVAGFDRSSHRIACRAELLCAFLDERTKLCCLLFQFGGIAASHLRRSKERNGREDVEDANLGGFAA
jgi:hypothetical protein